MQSLWRSEEGAVRRVPPRWLIRAAGLTCLLAGAACGGGAGHEVSRYQDLVAEPRGHTRVFDRTTGRQRCGEETTFGIAIAAGERRRYRVTLQPGSRLLVGACAERSDGAAVDLRIELTDASGRRERHLLEVGEAWADQVIELGSAAGQARLLVAAEGGTARIRDLAVESRGTAPAVRRAPRAVLISLDTFREDAIGAIGHRTRTPVLDGLLRESERFLPHWAADISTKPSHASLLSGLPVAVHGCDRGVEPLPAAVNTLAERLQAAGVETGGFLSVAPFFHPRFGLDQGFATWRLEAWSTAQELRAAANWIADHRDRPFFLFVHLFAAHSDSDQLPYEGSGASRDLVARRFGVEGYGCRRHACASRMLVRLNAGLLPRHPAEASILRSLYDRGVEELDADLGELFAVLRRAGLWDELLVILTADHGEQFAEHGYFLHTTAHEETLRVPLLVKWPRGAREGLATARPSSSLDVMPTVLAAFGVSAADLIGRDLGHPPGRRPVMVARDAVRLGDHKLLLATPEAPAALHDLAVDAAERTNLLASSGSEAVRLRDLLARYLAEARRRLGKPLPSVPGAWSAEELEQLRALGYAGDPSAPSS